MFISKYRKKIAAYNPDLFSDDNKKVLRYAIIIVAVGIALFIYDIIVARFCFDGTLNRNKIGAGKYTEDIQVEIDEEQFDYEITVNATALKEEEIKACFEKAKKEIDETCLHETESLDHIEQGLITKETYVGGLVHAAWEFDNYKLLNVDGSISSAEILPSGEIVTARITLACQEKTEEYVFAFKVFPKTLSSLEKAREIIDESIRKSDEQTAYDSKIVLPEVYQGKQINWKRKINFRGLQIAVLASVVVLGVIFGSQADIKKKEQNLIKRKLRDYPQIVSNLSILMGAGMSFKAAVDRMCKSYVLRVNKDASNKSPGYEELLVVGREIHDGVGEIEAINNMGKRSGVKEYRKLAMLLTQNIKKGTTDLILMLEKEDHLAFELRKNMAIRAGEEASTKLMLPMMGMLAIVLVILMVPAMLSMNM